MNIQHKKIMPTVDLYSGIHKKYYVQNINHGKTCQLLYHHNVSFLVLLIWLINWKQWVYNTLTWYNSIKY